MVEVITFGTDEWDQVLVSPDRLSPIIARFYGAAEYQAAGDGNVAVYGEAGTLLGYFQGAGNPQFVQNADGTVTMKLRELIPA